MSQWTREDVDRHNAKLGAKMPAHVRSLDKITISKSHKFKAIPCIVTPDLTLFTKPEIDQADMLSEHPLRGTGTLLERGIRANILGEGFASTKEAKRWIQLRACENAGTLRNLRRQVPLELLVNGEKIGRWDADFVYEESTARADDWPTVYEDSKGIRTPLYKRSKAHVKAQYGITIRET